MDVVVLGGCGGLASYAVRDLVAHCQAPVTIADYRLDPDPIFAALEERGIQVVEM